MQLAILCYQLLLSGKMVKKCTSYKTEYHILRFLFTRGSRNTFFIGGLGAKD
jgi:hypothetical protein